MEAGRILIVGHVENYAAVLAVVMALASCGTSKRVITTHTNISEEVKEYSLDRESIRLETVEYGDTLKGTVPIRPLSDIPIVIPVQSRGIDLELSITEGSISYTTVARPVARSALSYESETVREESRDMTINIEEEEVRETKRTLFPWWVYPVGIITIALTVFIIILNQNPLKWLKK